MLELVDEQPIFNEARNIESIEARRRYLDDVCAGNQLLRDRVEALLRVDEHDRSFLHPLPNLWNTRDAAIQEGPGTVIGPYRLLEQIGEGGFGVVFMAEQQQPVRRKVALKIVKLGMDTRHVVARFEAERQALALMDHPHIAQIFDGGATESGRPFFVMELVRGNAITDFCDQHQLGIRARLELFTNVCQAVQHAHQKGIIHRDLKPSNILVTWHDDKPVVKVIDFGIAKATSLQLTEKTLTSNLAQMIGTPTYMSPEQAQMGGLDVDTRSDVYSLGALLYELMTGHTPFDKKRMHTVAIDELIRIIREEEPVRPSTRISLYEPNAKTLLVDRNSTREKLSRLLRGELDWIIMKALEKDRNRRYESASALAQEVQRYLRNEPVQACPPTLGYRLRKVARQHRAALVSAALMFAAVTAGTSVAIWQAVVATQAKQIAEGKEAEAQAVLSFLEHRVLDAARPEGQSGGLGHDVSLRGAIEAALPFVDEEFNGQPLIEARLRMTLGYSFNCIGDWEKSVEQYSAAHALYLKVHGSEHRATLRALTRTGDAHTLAGQREEGRKLLEDAYARQTSLLGSEHPDTLNTMDRLAGNLDEHGLYNDALTLREKGFAICQAKFVPDHRETLRSMNNLSVSYLILGRNDDALKLRERMVSICKVKLKQDHPDLLMISYNLANSYFSLGRYRDACKMHEEGLSLRKMKLGLDHPNTLRSMGALSQCYRMLGREMDALALIEETLELQKRKLGHEHPDTVSTMSRLAISYSSVGRTSDAIGLHEKARKLQLANLGPDHADTLDNVHNLAVAYRAAKRHEEALKLDIDTLARRQRVLGADHPSTLTSMSCLANTYGKLGRQEDALDLHKRTLDLRTAKLGSSHPDTLRSKNNIAWTYRSLKRLDDARNYGKQAWEGRRAVLGANHPDTLLSMTNLGIYHSELGQHAEALALHQESWELLKTKLGAAHQDTLDSMVRVAKCFIELDRGAEAVPLIDEYIQRASTTNISPDNIAFVMDLRLRHFEKARDVAGVRATAAMWKAMGRTDADSLYNAACGHALLAWLIRDLDKSAETDVESQVEADAAMELLRKSVAAGFADADHMKKDSDLDLLRDRSDFKQLMTDLTATPKPNAK